jgi:pseudo-rSAM protein
LSKKQKQKNFWFILDNYVHVSLKGNSLMFYNPLTGKILEYTGSESIIKLVKRLQSPKNLLVIRLTETELLNPEISQFVRDLRGYFMGDLLDTSLEKGKPVQMMPVVKVHKDAEIIKKSPSRSVGEHMMQYLAEVSIYINNTCSLDCEICGSAYKQFLCCTRAGGKGKEETDILTIKHLFRQLKASPLVRVNILGGDIGKFSKLDELSAVLDGQSQSFKKVFYIHYLNLLHQEEKFVLSRGDSLSLKILVTFPVEKDRWQQVLETLQANDIDAHFLFIIRSESELAEAEELVSLFHLDNYSLHPFYNGRNLLFFRQNIFLDREDLQEAKPTSGEILARQVVNPLHFGTLTVLNNGDVHANVNESRLGTLKRDSIYDMVYKEMARGKSWRRIRKKMEPCKSCTFEALCPPLSNYEYALGRNDLCHIRDTAYSGSVLGRPAARKK